MSDSDIPNVSTWEIVLGARRPGLADVGGNQLLNDEVDPPNPDGTELTALSCNQERMQIAALGAVVPMAIMDVEFSAGTPAITSLLCANTTLDASDFTVTDSGTGITTIAWSTVDLPPIGPTPRAALIMMAVRPTIFAEKVSATPTTTTIRVTTLADNVAADLDFSLAIY